MQENNLIDYSLLIGIHDLQMESNVNDSAELEIESNQVFEDKVASASDGLGTLASSWQLSSCHTNRQIIPLMKPPIGTNMALDNLSGGDDDDDEDEGVLIPEHNTHLFLGILRNILFIYNIYNINNDVYDDM